ncbi:hypothetical protein WJX73_004362 [Symbiochloris irregularis]|uniref:Cyclase n=1 Tax=Symbiochloris irregularis TaxID=706552 RepID=A0AAW1PFA8_9CHLO
MSKAKRTSRQITRIADISEICGVAALSKLELQDEARQTAPEQGCAALFLAYALLNAESYGLCPSSSQKRIIDISLPITAKTPSWDEPSGVGEFRKLVNTYEDEMPAAVSEINVGMHTATHVDAPSHFVKHYFDRGLGVEELDLAVLNGPALVVQTPEGTNITAAVLESLKVPKGVTRILFKTDNSARDLLHKTAFHTDYTSISADGSAWLVKHTDWKLIGIDYLSVSTYEDNVEGHQIMLGKEIIQVEGLVLKHVEPGQYDLHCLHINVPGADGALARCILMH